jgi:GNAT superfamily N-acetyltransferase
MDSLNFETNKKMEIIIRKAVEKDCEQIMKLVHELANYEKLAGEVTVDFDHFVQSGFGSNPIWWGIVAEDKNEVIGFALYYIRFSTWKGQRMYLEDLLVTEKMRGKGIGRLLFDELIKEAKGKNFSGITWQVLDWNEPAINFYKKLGDVDITSGWLNAALNF